MKKIHKCHYCKEEITNEELLVKIDISKDDTKKVMRNFHNSCVDIYKKVQEEKRIKELGTQQFRELRSYIEKEILSYPESMKITKHMVTRIFGLRSGNYSIKRGNKVVLSDRGYPYNIILLTFKIKKIDILKSIKGKVFTSENHKFDYIMVIISNSINDVYLRYMEKEKNKEKFEELKIDYEEKTNVEYKNNANLKENKVANLLKDLF